MLQSPQDYGVRQARGQGQSPESRLPSRPSNQGHLQALATSSARENPEASTKTPPGIEDWVAKGNWRYRVRYPDGAGAGPVCKYPRRFLEDRVDFPLTVTADHGLIPMEVPIMTVTCRTCKSKKTAGDICPVCTSGMVRQTMLIRKAQPISLARAHFFHAPAAGVLVSTAKGDRRI